MLVSALFGTERIDGSRGKDIYLRKKRFRIINFKSNNLWALQFDERLEKWFDSISFNIKAKILRITDMLVSFGASNVRKPYVKPVIGFKKLFEIVSVRM